MALHHPVQIVPTAWVVDLQQTLLAQSEFTGVNSRVERRVTTAGMMGRWAPNPTAITTHQAAHGSVEGGGCGIDLLLAFAAIRYAAVRQCSIGIAVVVGGRKWRRCGEIDLRRSGHGRRLTASLAPRMGGSSIAADHVGAPLHLAGHGAALHRGRASLENGLLIANGGGMLRGTGAGEAWNVWDYTALVKAIKTNWYFTTATFIFKHSMGLKSIKHLYLHIVWKGLVIKIYNKY